jgi:hypothetical protein
MMKSLLLAGAGALLLGSLAIPASAAPAVGGFKTGAETSAVDHVNYRRCWHRHGHLVCRRGYGYRYGYAPYYDDDYYGYGYGPSIGLSFGGGGHHRGHGHFGGHRR